MTKKCALFGLALFALCSSAGAENAIHYREGDRIDPLEVAKVLSGQAQQQPRIRTRSLKLLDQPSASDEAKAGVSSLTAGASSLSIPVRFAFDSSEIQPSMRAQLDAIAEGIKMTPGDHQVVVEGHTDGVGSESYNLELSQRRALAVKNYLVTVHGIDAARLKQVGYGKYRPIDGKDPFAPENRRVQFRPGS
jgi:outer membrane protein OmpA-like peptidoglycan-associated protein